MCVVVFFFISLSLFLDLYITSASKSKVYLILVTITTSVHVCFIYYMSQKISLVDTNVGILEKHEIWLLEVITGPGGL